MGRERLLKGRLSSQHPHGPDSSLHVCLTHQDSGLGDRGFQHPKDTHSGVTAFQTNLKIFPLVQLPPPHTHTLLEPDIGAPTSQPLGHPHRVYYGMLCLPIPLSSHWLSVTEIIKWPEGGLNQSLPPSPHHRLCRVLCKPGSGCRFPLSPASCLV